jgi:hypothetical protein
VTCLGLSGCHRFICQVVSPFSFECVCKISDILSYFAMRFCHTNYELCLLLLCICIFYILTMTWSALSLGCQEQDSNCLNVFCMQICLSIRYPFVHLDSSVDLVWIVSGIDSWLGLFLSYILECRSASFILLTRMPKFCWLANMNLPLLHMIGLILP